MPFCTEFEYAKHPPNRLDSMNKFKRKKTSKEIKVSNFARKERKMQVANLNCCWVQCKASMWNSNVICWNVKTKSKRNQSKVGVFQYSQAFSQGNIPHVKKHAAKMVSLRFGLMILLSLCIGQSLGWQQPWFGKTISKTWPDFKIPKALMASLVNKGLRRAQVSIFIDF